MPTPPRWPSIFTKPNNPRWPSTPIRGQSFQNGPQGFPRPSPDLHDYQKMAPQTTKMAALPFLSLRRVFATHDETPQAPKAFQGQAGFLLHSSISKTLQGAPTREQQSADTGCEWNQSNSRSGRRWKLSSWASRLSEAKPKSPRLSKGPEISKVAAKIVSNL